MKLTPELARERLAAQDHGVLATVHPERGVDTIPVVFAVDGDLLGIPIDRVKPKASTRLQRQDNLDHDPRASLLVQHWDAADWSKLWWARATLRAEPDADGTHARKLSALLATRYPHYADEPFERILVMRIVAVSGWSA